MKHFKFLSKLLPLSIVLCLFSCSPELELVDWIDRAEEACQCENLTEDYCIHTQVKFVVKEGKIENVYTAFISGQYDWEKEYADEWFKGPCSDAYACFKKHLIGKKVTEKSGSYERSVLITDSK